MAVYHLALEMTILLAFWLCLGVLQRAPGTPGRRTFAALTGSVMLCCLGELVIGGETLPAGWGDRIRLAGMLTLPALTLGLAAHATRLELARRVPWFPLILLAPLSVPFAMTFSETWSPVVMPVIGGSVLESGPLLWSVLPYAYVLTLLAAGLFVRGAWLARGTTHWRRDALLALAALLPLAGNAFFVARGAAYPVDPTPVLFGISLIALHSALFSGSLLQALPISQHDLIQQLPLGVILTDTTGAVIDLNPAAQLRLGIDEAAAVGRNLDAVLADTDDDFQADVAPISARGREVGQLVLIDPVGKDQ